MAQLRDFITYICKKYPRKLDLSKARLNKILYLADWKSAVQTGHQLTRIQWKYNHYGPYVQEVSDLVRNDANFEIFQTQTFYGDLKEVVQIKPDVDNPNLSAQESALLDEVIEKTAKLPFKKFIELVYATYPIMSQSRGESLNLETLATRYNELKSSVSEAR